MSKYIQIYEFVVKFFSKNSYECRLDLPVSSDGLNMEKWCFVTPNGKLLKG